MLKSYIVISFVLMTDFIYTSQMEFQLLGKLIDYTSDCYMQKRSMRRKEILLTHILRRIIVFYEINV